VFVNGQWEAFCTVNPLARGTWTFDTWV